MNVLFLFDTLLVWIVQICILAAIGGLLSLTLSHPKARLFFWQGLLLLLLLLPLVEPWRASPPDEGIPALTEDSNLFPGAGPTFVLQTKPFGARADWLWVLAFGAAIRLLWIAIGFFRLSRYRRESRKLAEAPVLFGRSSAEWYLHDRLPGPVTYGWLRPRVLLPTRFESMEPSVQEAIACHELVHISRHDWLFVVAEEFVRSVFWFHPAIWFVLSRIQLAREQVVDREVIRLTKDRDRYLDALVAVAAHNIPPDLAPAPLFLKKRHLARRVAAVLQEVSMSRPRLYGALATVCSVLLLTARLSVWLVPFSLPAQVVPDDPGVTVSTGARILHRTPVHVPPDVRTQGTVVLEVSLNAKGEVSDAHILGGPEELRKMALASVLNWHFEAGVNSAQVAIRIFQDKPSAHPDLGPTFRIDPASADGAFPAILKNIKFTGLSAEAAQELRSRLPIREGSSMGIDDVSAVLKAIGDIDSHLRPTVQIRKSEFDLLIALPAASDSGQSPEFPPPAPGVKRIRVGGDFGASNLVTKVTPKYPMEAKAARTQGVVRFAALIGVDGAIQEVRVLSGDPILAQTAMEAIKQWIYRPTLLNGNPVEVVTQIDVNFTLSN